MTHDDQDIEMNPPKLKFGMSKSELAELEDKEKARRKKLTKGWKPEGH
jgi:hypothetical protein